MLDLSFLPQSGNADVQTFMGLGSVATNGEMWHTWIKPRGKSMCHILLVGKGGNGGNGAVGANSTAAGGGGGGSGSMLTMTLPMWAIPDRLYLSLAGSGTLTAATSYITTSLKLTAGAGAPATADTFAIAPGGGNGGNASGATAGAAGAAGAIPTVTNMLLGWVWSDTALAGQAGIIGGVAVAGGALALPTTGLLVTGGTGGGGLPAAAAVGTAGGAITGAGAFPTSAGGVGGSAATTPAGVGNPGTAPLAGVFMCYGGTGGGSSHGSASGAGLFGGNGAPGAPGCGGGGGGGCLTAGTAGVGGRGGPAFCIITSW